MHSWLLVHVPESKATGQVKGDVLHSLQLIEKQAALVAAGVPESKATGQVKGGVLAA